MNAMMLWFLKISPLYNGLSEYWKSLPARSNYAGLGCFVAGSRKMMSLFTAITQGAYTAVDRVNRENVDN